MPKTFNRYDKLRETLANPFRRKRRANGETRYLNKRQERENSTLYDRSGNMKT